MHRRLPGGTVTFLFTDIEGSTALWEHFPEIMYAVIARHDALLTTCMQESRGSVFKTVGDAFCVAFETAGEALNAAISTQRILAKEAWPEQIAQLRVRMALHTGEAERRNNDYFGQTLNRVARILAAGHGGQVLLSRTTLSLLEALMPPDVTIHDLGEHRLKDMQHPEHLFQLVISGLPSTFPPLKTLDRHPNNLPTQLTPFIGRETDLQTLHALLLQEHVRLLTLTGPGGTGKTRLSLQLAANSSEFFADGIYFVELEHVRETDQLATVIADTLRVRQSRDQTAMERLKSFLNTTILLVLDNFEQIVDAAPALLELLMTCPRLKILVTSRAALHISGEHEYYVAPLALPLGKRPFDLADLAQNEAVAFFILRARTVKPDFQLTPTNAAAIVAICRELDGLPLAIELAAARINLLSPQALLKRLGQRFKLLTSGERDRSERQQTLRGAIAWSYDLMEPHEKAAFTQLAIFAEGCTLDAIEAVCSISEDSDHDLLDTLYSLINKSLLRQQEQANGEPRFFLLHTIREYAREQLQQQNTLNVLQQRHATYYLDLAEQSLHASTGTEQKHWQDRLEQEHANLQAALQWCIEQKQTQLGLQLAGTLWKFWLMHGHLQQHYASLEQLLAESDASIVAAPTRARALEGASRFALHLNKSAPAGTFAAEMLQLGQAMHNDEIVSSAYVIQADIAMRQGDLQQAVTLLEQSLQIRSSQGDTRGMATLLNNLGNLALARRQFEQAEQFHQRSLALFRELHDDMAIAHLLTHLGKVALLRENYEQAIVLYEESMKRCRDLGDARGTATALLNLGVVAFYQDAYRPALHQYKESLELFRELDDPHGIAICLARIAEVAYAWQHFESATRLLAQAQSLNGSITGVAIQHDQHHADTTMQEALRLTIGPTLFDVLWESGSTMSLEQVMLEIAKLDA